MGLKFRFNVANMLRATAWAAASCFAWSEYLNGFERLPHGNDAVEFILFIVMFILLVPGPMLAVAALFGRTKQELGSIALATVALCILAGLLLPTVQ